MKKLFILLLLSLSLHADKTLTTVHQITLNFTQAQLNTLIKTQLPHEIDYMYIFNLKLTDAHISFIENSDRIKAQMDSVVTMYLGENKTSFIADIELSSGVEYFASRESLYLNKPHIEHITIKDLDPKYTNAANAAITSALISYYEDQPVYTLSENDKKSIGNKIKDIKIKDQNLFITLKI